MLATSSHSTDRGLPSDRSTSTSTKLDFEQAMADFQIMFPSADPHLIEHILRTNNGAVEKTIDDLLLICSEKTDHTNDSDEPVPLLAPLLPPRPPPLPSRRPSSTPSVKKPIRWNPPLVGPLPDDFLRISNSSSVKMPFHHDPEPRKSLLNVGHVRNPKQEKEKVIKAAKSKQKPAAETVAEDKINSYLQNEDFLRELERDEEFLAALQKDGRDNSAFSSSLDQPASTVSSSATGNRTLEDSNDFKNKLKKNMGLVSKQRLNNFAKQFSLGKKKSAKAILSKSAPSAYNHLIEDNNSLVSDDDDGGDDDHVAEGSSHVRLDRRASQGT